MKSTAKAAHGHRQQVIQRLQHTLSAPRALIQLDLPPAIAAHFTGLALRPASVLVPLLDSENGLEVLLTQRSDSLRVHAGQVSFPGGSRDPDDRDEVDTALRETEEEIGLAREAIQVIGLLDDYPTGTGFRVTPVVGLVGAQASMQADGAEVTALLRVPLDYLLDSRHYRRGSFMRNGVELPFFEVTWHEHRIWGATAGMLLNLGEKLRRA